MTLWGDSGGIAAIPPRGNERALSGPIQTVTASGPASLSDPGCGETRAFEDCAAVIRLPFAFDSRGLDEALC